MFNVADSKRAKATVSFWLCVLLAVSAKADGVPPEVVQACVKRSQALGDCTLVWSVSVSQSSSPVPPQVRQQWYDMIYQQSLQRTAGGGRRQQDAQQEAHEAARSLVQAMDTALAPRSYRTQYIITRLAGDLYVLGREEILTPGQLSFTVCTVRYTEGYAIRFEPWTEVGGRIVTAQDVLKGSAHFLAPASARVWAAPGHAANYRSCDRPMDLMPEVLCLVAVRDPLTLYSSSWLVERDDAHIMRLSTQVNKGNMAPFRVQLTLDKKRGMALSQAIVTYLHRRGGEQYLVSRWQRKSGVWVPVRVEEKQWDDDRRMQRIWDLQRITLPYKTAAIPIGFPVQDRRLLGAYATDNDVATRTDNIVGYRWDGRLPDLSELRAIKNRQPAGASPLTGQLSLVRFVAPLLLILIGALWYWRLRVKK